MTVNFTTPLVDADSFDRLYKDYAAMKAENEELRRLLVTHGLTLSTAADMLDTGDL